MIPKEVNDRLHVLISEGKVMFASHANIDIIKQGYCWKKETIINWLRDGKSTQEQNSIQIERTGGIRTTAFIDTMLRGLSSYASSSRMTYSSFISSHSTNTAKKELCTAQHNDTV